MIIRIQHILLSELLMSEQPLWPGGPRQLRPFRWTDQDAAFALVAFVRGEITTPEGEPLC